MSAPGNANPAPATLAGAELEALVRREEVRLSPLAAAFDADRVAVAVRTLGASFRDEADPSRFVLVPDKEASEAFQARRRAEPAAPFPYMPLVAVTPDELRFAPIANHPELRELSLSFLRWLAANYECRLVPDGEDDAEDEPETA